MKRWPKWSRSCRPWKKVGLPCDVPRVRRQPRPTPMPWPSPKCIPGAPRLVKSTAGWLLETFCDEIRQPQPAVLRHGLRKDLLTVFRSEEHTSELQSLRHLVCRLLLE